MLHVTPLQQESYIKPSTQQLRDGLVWLQKLTSGQQFLKEIKFPAAVKRLQISANSQKAATHPPPTQTLERDRKNCQVSMKKVTNCFLFTYRQNVSLLRSEDGFLLIMFSVKRRGIKVRGTDFTPCRADAYRYLGSAWACLSCLCLQVTKA